MWPLTIREGIPSVSTAPTSISILRLSRTVERYIANTYGTVRMYPTCSFDLGIYKTMNTFPRNAALPTHEEPIHELPRRNWLDDTARF